MTVFLILLLSLAVVAILLGPPILSAVDRHYLYPKRHAKVAAGERTYPPSNCLPDHIPPAIVSQLVFFDDTKGKSYTRFTVTLLDLAHRNKIFVTPKERELYFSPLGDDSDLRPFEKTVVEFLRAAAGEKKYISLTDLKSYINEHRVAAREMRTRFLRALSDEFVTYGYAGEVDYERPTHPLVLIGMIAVAVSVGALLGWIAGNIPLGVIALGLATVASALCTQVFQYKLSYLTEKGMEWQARWRAYGAYLDTLSNPNGRFLFASSQYENAAYAAALEKNALFADFSVVWGKLADEHPECRLYDPYYYKKLTQIDYSILILSVQPEETKKLKFDE